MRHRIAPARLALLLLFATLSLTGVACGGGEDSLVLGATTSLQDTGILDALIARFEAESEYDVRPVVAGSGQVLELARRGEVDATITHSPDDEQKLLADGDTLERTPFIQNYFVVAGPPGDPAGVKDAVTLGEAFAAIAGAGADFVSRGDRSGTHIRELSLWREIGVDPAGEPWYQESAVGQAQNLLVASDKGAYTLVDDSTFLVLRDKLDLIAFITDRDHPNVYSVMTVSPERHAGVNADAARAFAEFLASQPALDIIAAFGQEEYGQPLFSLHDDGP